MKRLLPDLLVLLACSLLLFLPGFILGCTTSSQATTEPDEQITVEGTVTVRGNEPFSAPVLETQDRNYYVLVLTPELRQQLVTPGTYRLSGVVYLDTWLDRPFAHLRVTSLERL